MLHEQLQKERPAAERAERLVGSHGVQKFLYAGNIRRIQQKSVFLPKSGLFQKEPLFIISLSGAQQIFADAGADGSGNFQMVIQRNILALRAIGAGRHGGRAFFQQGKQRIQPFRAIADVR